jgi:hypothetical protein
MKYSTILLFLGVIILNDMEQVSAETIVEDMGEEDPAVV